MKAYKHIKYANPEYLVLGEIKKPKPEKNEILIKVCATTVNRTDCAMLKADPFVWRFFMGLTKPKNSILGSEFAGMVEQVGAQVSKFKIGDRVFGFHDRGLGAHAEYMAIPENTAIEKIPEGISFEHAAASCEGAHYAINFINKVSIKPGHKIIINGATGGIGMAALQLCKNLGAYVTATCKPENEALIRSLGAHKTIIYTEHEFTRDDELYDFVFDTVGKSTFGKCKRILKPGGTYMASELGTGMQNLWFSLITWVFKRMPFSRGKKVKFPFPADIPGSVAMIGNLLQRNKFKPVIDKTYSFNEVTEAFKYVDQGLKTGNVVIKVN